MTMKEKHLALLLLVLLTDGVHWSPLDFYTKLLRTENYNYAKNDDDNQHRLPTLNHCQVKQRHARTYGPSILLADAKGVAGLGKAGGEGQGGADKAGQQVPPEVYMALTYAGTLFLFTLSVPLILYGLNKLLNKIEDCFGCGPSSKRKVLADEKKEKFNVDAGGVGGTTTKQTNGFNSAANSNDPRATINTISASIDQRAKSNNGRSQQQQQQLEQGKQASQSQRQMQHNLNLQMMHQHPKYTQFVSVSIPDYRGETFPAYSSSGSNNNNNNNCDKRPQLEIDHPATTTTTTATSAQPSARYNSLQTNSPSSRQASAPDSCPLNML